MIKGGYYIKARQIKDSEIAHCAPVVREVWDYLIRECNYAESRAHGLKRGQMFRSLQDISDALHWFVGYRKMSYTKTQCEKAMKTLTKMGMVTTTKTTRGLIITVCNYDTYQDPKNYEDDTEDFTKAARRREGDDTINKKNKNKEEREDIVDKSPQQILKERKVEFGKTLEPYVEKYGREMLVDFYNHWGEANPSGTKLKWEMQKTWELELRLQKWQRNNDKWQPKQNIPTQTTGAANRKL